MDPEILAAGAGVVGGIAQFMNSQQARAASSDELNTMQELYNKMQLPNFNPASITPQEYQVAQKYVPQITPYVQENAPETIKQTADMSTGRQAQRDALSRLKDISSNQGMDPQFASALNQASERAGIEAKSKNDAALQSANRMGMLGSGQQLAAQLQGNSDAMSRSADQGNQAAAQAYQGRLQALMQSSQLGGQLQNEDESLQAQNANIINAYNQRNAGRLQNQNNLNTGVMNQANEYNTGAANNAANMNTSTANQMAQYNQQRADTNAQKQYNNQMGIANATAGIDQQRIGQIMGAAQDKNQAIQGITNVGVGAAQKQRANQYGQKSDDDEEDMEE